MAYQRTTWVAEVTQLSAANMNNIEDGIEEAMENTPVIHVSTEEPTALDGNNGEFWVVYTAPEEEESEE